MRIHIRALKYIILTVAILLLGILLIYTQPQVDLIPLPKSDNVKLSLEDEKSAKEFENATNKEITDKALDKTITQSPSFVGEDKNSKLWILKATKAIQTGGLSTGETNLFNVVAQTLSKSNSKIDYFADKGEYFPAENKVILQGNVMLKSKDIQIKTEELEYNLVTGFGETKSKVYIKTKKGTLEGNSLKAYNGGERFILEGRVKAVLYNRERGK